MSKLKVENRQILIVGDQSSGWGSAFDSLVKDSRLVSFTLMIEGEEDTGYLLLLESSDGLIYSDTWHMTVEEAQNVAEEEYKVPRSAWLDI